MWELIWRYLFGFLVGSFLGYVYPELFPTWIILFIPVIIIIATELYGGWGFGNRWHDYRVSVYALHTAVAFLTWFGVLLGSGVVGTFLTIVGKAISR